MKSHHSRNLGSERGAMMAIVLMVLASVLVMALMTQKFASIAMPGMSHARISSNEASAVAALRVINGSQAQYSATCANGGFATSLDDLGKAPNGQDVAFIASDLAKNGIVKSGYAVMVEKDGKPNVVDLGVASSTCNGAAENPVSSYFASAVPSAPGTSGIRYFATDARGIIYASDSPIENPIVESDTVKPVKGGEGLEKLDEQLRSKAQEKEVEEATAALDAEEKAAAKLDDKSGSDGEKPGTKVDMKLLEQITDKLKTKNGVPK